MTLAKYVMIFALRTAMIMSIIGVFLPPDAQNPHVFADAFLCIASAFFWTASDRILNIRVEP